METSPMAGKSWQPSRESPHRKGRQAPITLSKQWKEGGKGGENCLDDELALLTMLQVHMLTRRVCFRTQKLLQMVIISFILMTLICDSG
ncbi:hypothetical protein pdam_00012369 [Pocillopora damicornis]|uniref:Uncharacterized protein n=1 Tax=Pocillopora damicornis TaxID=46731 RepID=A0A3M6TIR3_POCDA|nr:hypothetical protein pdam_00012369 [Pocillopora damicornis]